MARLVFLLGALLSCMPSAALRIEIKKSSDAPIYLPSVCKEEPEDFESWWLYIDAKDAHKGKHAFDDDVDHKDYLNNVGLAVKNQQKLGQSKLSLDVIAKIVVDTGNRHGKMNGHSRGQPGTFIQPECSNLMSCEETKGLIEELPTFLYKSKGTAECPRNIVPGVGMKDGQTRPRAQIRGHLKKIVDIYNDDVDKATDQNSLFRSLAKLARGYMWLHPYDGMNNRVRTVILQREVRRLGLGCGLIMWNNGKAIYVDTLDQMAEKIKIGIEYYEKAVATGKNPYVVEETKNEYFTRMPDSEGKKKCVEAIKKGLKHETHHAGSYIIDQHDVS